MNGCAGVINRNTVDGLKSDNRRKQGPQTVGAIPKKIIGTPASAVSRSQDINVLDLQSRMGRFGWPEASTDVYYGIPYILRESMKYFSIQMILTKPQLRTYFFCLHPDVYNYYFRVTTSASRAECYLLNEINRMHCENRFGTSLFEPESVLLINETNAYELWEFLDTCYRTLTFCPKIVSNKIGFIQFSFCSIYIPYVVRNNDRYMPLYCFSNVNNMPVDYISGWDLAYLRFCCMYQGVWRGSSDIFAVVSLSAVVANLPFDTNFITCWPTSCDHQLMRNVSPVKSAVKPKFNVIGAHIERDTALMTRRQTFAADVGPADKRQAFARKRIRGTVVGTPPNKVRRREDFVYQPSHESNQKVHAIASHSYY